MDDTSYSALEKLSAEWNKAEGLMKLAERVRAEVVFPSVNELRYAGRRLVDAWVVIPKLADDPSLRTDFDSFLKDALFRCYCAQHDAIDAAILFIQAAVDEYEKEFGISLLMTHFPEVADLRLSLREADQLIVSSRKERGKRAEEYDRLAVDHLPTITLVYSKIMSNRSALESLVADKAKADRRDSWRYRGNLAWGAAFVVIGAILAFAFALIQPTVSRYLSKPAEAVAAPSKPPHS